MIRTDSSIKEVGVAAGPNTGGGNDFTVAVMAVDGDGAGGSPDRRDPDEGGFGDVAESTGAALATFVSKPTPESTKSETTSPMTASL